MITQILLAAGLSTRMKSPKPLLDFGGRSLLSCLLEECHISAVDEIFVVLGHEKEKILEQVDLSGVHVVVNNQYEDGQTSSLQCAVRDLSPETEAFLNLPVDHPLVTHKEIDSLIEAYQAHKSEANIFVPECEGVLGRPVLFNSSLAHEVLNLDLKSPTNGIIERYHREIHRVPVTNPYTTKDMDTPDDYRECIKLWNKVGVRDVC
jgi:molybdenum cofactor cytidylyltransferase